MSTYDSIILLGYSGIGKDTLTNLLVEDYPNLVNVKFSALTKDMLAQAWRVPRHYLDGTDKEPKWREQKLMVLGNLVDVTPLDVLVALFHGAQTYDKLHQANIKYALDSIPKGCTPVFTDVRRQKELDAIVGAGWNPYVIRLISDKHKQGAADGEIDSIKHHRLLSRTYLDVADTYETLKGFLSHPSVNLLKIAKPTLHVYIGCEPHTYPPALVPNYEPLSLAIDTLANSLCDIGVPQADVHKRLVELLSAFVSEADLSKVMIPEITQDSYLIYQPAHARLLPKLREMAKLQLHVALISDFKIFDFTQQELENVYTY